MRGKEQSARIEQRTLTLSLVGVAAIAFASLAWGLAIESDVVILNGIFSLVSLVGSVLYLVAARLVTRPADRRFQYGYAHVEPLVNGVNALLVLVICVYAFVNGVEGLRAGGDEVDAGSVVWFGALTAVVSLAIGGYEMRVGRLTGSQLVRNDGREWLLDAAFSLVTLVGFAVLFVLPEPQRGLWARYADSVLVMVLALAFLPVPITVLKRSAGELLHMASEDDAIAARVEAEMRVDSHRARHPEPQHARCQDRSFTPRGGQHRRRPRVRAPDRARAGRLARAHLGGGGPADPRGVAHHQHHLGPALGMSSATRETALSVGQRTAFPATIALHPDGPGPWPKGSMPPGPHSHPRPSRSVVGRRHAGGPCGCNHPIQLQEHRQ
jgi:cation diffusion facilitator family transporter